MTLPRRAVLGAALATAARPALAQRPDVLRIVPGSALTVLDPIWTPAGVTTGHAYHVFDTLFAVDRGLNVRPQMAEGIETAGDGRTATIRLREGLRFHDGAPVLARDCIASIARWGRRDSFGSLLLRALDAMDAPDDRTMRIRYKTPFRRTADALAHPVANACFVMPERLAKTDPLQQVTEMVGSGPYRFLADEFVAGSKVAYARFDGYVPRAEPADYASGGKRAGFARIEWQVIPDPATAAAALANGEVDWWEVAPADLVGQLRGAAGVRVEDSDPFYAALRFNCLQPPFDNAALRHAVLTAVDQTDYMQAISSPDEHAWRTCFAMLGCGEPHVAETRGAALMTPPRDLSAARAAVAAAGYKGEKVVILNPTDLPAIGPHGEITADLLRRLGMNVDLQEMDWGTVNQRRVSREGTDKSGWSIFHINTPAIAISNPALDFFIRGQGGNGGFFGWYASPAMEEAAAAWLDVPPGGEDAVFDRVQEIAFADAPIVPLGMFSVRTAHRADLQGVIPASVLFPWNVRRA